MKLDPRSWIPVMVMFALASFPLGTSAVEIGGEGLGIIGVNAAIDSSPGTPLEHAGSALNLNDGNFNSSVDTFGGGVPFSYVGVVFNPPRADLVVSFTLHIAAFFDGGWFGPNNSGPGASGTLNPTHLTEPTLQVTFDSGSTWVNAPASSNYIDALDGTILPVAFTAPTHADPAIFTLTTPQTGINGIRLVGSEGGTASGGFLGVFEVGVEAIPEPSAALALVSGAALLALRRRGA